MAHKMAHINEPLCGAQPPREGSLPLSSRALLSPVFIQHSLPGDGKLLFSSAVGK